MPLKTDALLRILMNILFSHFLGKILHKRLFQGNFEETAEAAINTCHERMIKLIAFIPLFRLSALMAEIVSHLIGGTGGIHNFG